MKKLILFLAFSPFMAYTQGKYGNIWLIGGGPVSISKLNWNYDTLTISKSSPSQAPVDDLNTCISDKNGNLLFYTSGCNVSSAKNFKILPNGKNINPGETHDLYCGTDSEGQYPSNNNVLFLPHPTDTTIYYLFHMGRGDADFPGDALAFNRFYYSLLSTKKGTNGDIIKKNVLLTESRLSEVGPVACKHGNGRDWWVIVPKTTEHSYFRALMTKDTVLYEGEQILGDKFGRSTSQWQGQCVFSPDGNKYVRSDPSNGTYIYDFDRCTGNLSSPIFIDTIGPYGYGVSGVAVSPNSRYLYIFNRIYVHQFDLSAKDVLSTKVKVGQYNGEVNDWGSETYIYKAQLAPDNKIYASVSGTNQYLHVISYPDSSGLACKFKINALRLPTSCGRGLPNMSNFNLGAKKGSVCEKALSVGDITSDLHKIHVFPNPSSTYLKISLREYYERLIIYDVNGREIQRITTNREESNYKIDVSLYLPGIYFISGLNADGKKIGGQKFAVE